MQPSDLTYEREMFGILFTIYCPALNHLSISPPLILGRILNFLIYYPLPTISLIRYSYFQDVSYILHAISIDR